MRAPTPTSSRRSTHTCSRTPARIRPSTWSPSAAPRSRRRCLPCPGAARAAGPRGRRRRSRPGSVFECQAPLYVSLKGPWQRQFLARSKTSRSVFVSARWRNPGHRCAHQVVRRQFDPQPFHLDDAPGPDALFGGLVASGWHTAAVVMRLIVDSDLGLGRGAGVAVEAMRWRVPVRAGDRLRVEGTVTETRPSRSHSDRGIVKFQTTVSQPAGRGGPRSHARGRGAAARRLDRRRLKVRVAFFARAIVGSMLSGSLKYVLPDIPDGRPLDAEGMDARAHAHEPERQRVVAGGGLLALSSMVLL